MWVASAGVACGEDVLVTGSDEVGTLCLQCLGHEGQGRCTWKVNSVRMEDGCVVHVHIGVHACV